MAGPRPLRTPARSFPPEPDRRLALGAALAAGTLTLTVPASVLLHRGMTAAGLACLVAMAACLAGTLAFLDPLRK